MTTKEYNVAQLWSVAETSKNETGGGEGVEVLDNEPFNETAHPPKPDLPVVDGREFKTGQYTKKIYHIHTKLPALVRYLVSKDKFMFNENAWNAFPYCRTIVTNDNYMKENFFVSIESMHVDDDGSQYNVHQLSEKELAQRHVVYIDIVNDELAKSNYDPDLDPSIFQSKKTGRGPLTGPIWWKNPEIPIMCAYKLVKCEFKWWGLQGQVEKLIIRQERKIFHLFHRQLFCWMDKWHGLTMEDVRALEDKTKDELQNQRKDGDIRGHVCHD